MVLACCAKSKHPANKCPSKVMAGYLMNHDVDLSPWESEMLKHLQGIGLSGIIAEYIRLLVEDE